jgi:hypothetical protein
MKNCNPDKIKPYVVGKDIHIEDITYPRENVCEIKFSTGKTYRITSTHYEEDEKIIDSLVCSISPIEKEVQ